MELDGRRASSATPAAATAAGVVCIFQELSLMPDLSVADNISISSPPKRFGMIDTRAQRRRAEALLAEVGCEDVNPLLRVRDLPLSRRQMVEIAKALGQKPKLLILDEATSALTSVDVEKVYTLLARLKAENVAILYISHRMHEVDALADRASVFRNGRHVETFDMGAAIDRRNRPADDRTRYRDAISAQADAAAAGAPALKIENLGWEKRLEGISLGVGSERSSASAASTDRARRLCCSRCSGCFAASPAISSSTVAPCAPARRPPPRRRASASRWFPKIERPKA